MQYQFKYLQPPTAKYEFNPEMEIDKLSGAEYNPRLLLPEKKAKLIESIKELGFLFPVIAFKRKEEDEKYILLAGHQRTTALKAMGRDTVPCVILKGKLNHTEERRVNQYHNEIENNDMDSIIKFQINCELKPGIQMIANKDFVITDKYVTPNIGSKLNNLIELMLGIGNFNTTIIGKNDKGELEILFGKEYVLACERIGYDYRVSYIDDPEVTKKARFFLEDKYGKNNFSSFMSQNTYIQSNAQPQRKKTNSSHTFTRFYALVDDEEGKGKRFLDLFCGKGIESDKIQKKKKGILKDMNRIELFYCSKRFNLSMMTTRYFIDQTIKAMERDLKNGGTGLYDYVICDSVINSVDSLQAEADVINCCVAFLKPGGMLFISGRLNRQVISYGNVAGTLYPMDDEGFCSYDYNGKWFFQRFHRDQAHALSSITNVTNQLGPLEEWDLDSSGGHFNMVFKKVGSTFTDKMKESVKREFDLCHGETSIGRGDKMVSLFEKIYEKLNTKPITQRMGVL